MTHNTRPRDLTIGCQTHSYKKISKYIRKIIIDIINTSEQSLDIHLYC